MKNNTVIKKASGKKLTPQVNHIRQQPRHQIRQLLRSFEPLETFNQTAKSKG
jgi:hypothetical protein